MDTYKQQLTHSSYYKQKMADNPHQLVVEWNQTQVNYPQSQCIHQFFEAQVEKTPDAIAVIFDDVETLAAVSLSLTYRELNERANQLAHHLQTLGVKPDVLVAVCAERSLLMVVGILGILKAGGAYVPLDPQYPTERLAFILDDTQAPIVLTQQKWVKNLPNHEAQVICLDSDWEIIANNSRENPVSEVTPDHLMYVIYTSGSTGKPKGVMIPHRGISNMLYWRQTTFGITPQDKVLQTISFSFDPSVWQVFWPLAFGAQLVMARPGGHQDSAYLIKTIIEQQITILGLVPSILRMLVEEPELESCKQLKHVTTGGEALPIELMEHFLNRLNLENVLLNCYGPTETSIDATYWICQRGKYDLSAPIGRPIANVQTYILNENLQPVAIGESGELYIGGAGLARGYLNHPELTNQKFIPNPFFESRGAEEQRGNSERIYKTGDLARYLPDGNIEFLGRVDDQVKLRGFRVELGEIEAILGQHSALQQAVVMVREDVPGNQQLVAYVVAKSGQTNNQIELRSFLQQRLPEYMVPAAFVFLDALPLNANGKIDRRAVPVPDSSSFIHSNSFVAPRTPIEKVLTSIWEQVLGLEQIGINDNFFALGGHSLLATRVISRVHEVLQVELSLPSLFEAPSVAGLARRIEMLNGIEPEKFAAIQPVSRDTDLPLSFAQTRLWFLNQLERESTAYNIPMALHLMGTLNVAALEMAVQEIVWRHEVLRTTFKLVNGSPVQVIAPPVIDFNVLIRDVGVTQAQNSQWDEVQHLVTEESQKPFDLEKGPLLRVTLLRLDKKSHVLLVTMHHIISDGWSLGIFVRELSSLYTAFSNGTSLPLPDLSIQYADFAHWQRQWLQEVGANGCSPLETQLAYWKQQLGGNLTLLDLPTDQPRPPIQSFRGAKQSIELSKALTQMLKALSQREGATLFMTLLAAFKTLLYRYVGQEDIVVGTPIAGRNRAEIEDLIGLFLNTLVLRTDLSGNPSFRELLGRVRKVALGAYAHPDIPFEKLVEELHPQRSLNRHPLFDVMFNFLNTPQATLEMPRLTLSPIELNEPESKFSMTLYVEEYLGQLKLQLVYQRDLFSAERMTRLLDQFQYLLEQIVTAPEFPISVYSLVTPESRPILPDPTAALREPAYDLVTTMFTAWANSTPQHSAICQGDRTWNYGELSTSAHSLTKVLLSYGVRRGEVVAVFGQRSYGLIVSMVSVFLSGGVLLTIDPKLPSQRQQIMLEESKAKYLLCTSEPYPEQKEIWKSLAVIYVNPYTGIATNFVTDNTEALHLPQLSPDDAAYIFFTSGTTGIPKGVVGCHKGLAHFLNWQRQTFTVGQHDRSAQLTGLSFDVALRDIFLPLTSGATLYLPAEGDELEPTKILRWLEGEQISLLHIVPSLAQSWLVNVPSEVSLSALKHIFFAGEPLKDTLIHRWRQTFPESGEIVNLYGPTETTLAKCYYRVPTDPLPGVQPIGSPLPETQALVLIEGGQLCGIGELGQIVIRTPFRSLGYVNASPEDRSRFAKNPFRTDEQDLVYYTGDRGRYRPDGSLEILGRLDRQVKIRGVRIELREIEMLLGEHPIIREIVVITREDQLGDKSLIAYVVPHQQQALTSTELRQFLLEKLPNYMMPSAFVILEALPLTPNGKLDRRALPLPNQVRVEPEETFVAPRNELEHTMTQIWEEVLGIQPISIRDNFFDMGGHSLLAIQLFNKIEKKFGVKIPLAILFQAGTIETLTQTIEQQPGLISTHQNQDSRTFWSSLVAIQPNGSKPPLFCMHPIGGEILCYRNLSILLGLDQPFYGLQSKGLDGKQSPHIRVEDMASHYIREIQTLQPHGPYFLMGYSFGGTVAFEVARQLHRQGEKIGILVMLDNLRAGYDSRAPFWKRMFLHVQNVSQQGPAYLKRKLVGWREWGAYTVKHRLENYKKSLNPHVSKTDEHLEVIDANILAAETYDFPVYSGQITLLRTEDQNRSDAVGMRYDPQYGWGHLATGGVDTYYIPGSHSSLLEEPHIQEVVRIMKVCLTQAQAESYKSN